MYTVSWIPVALKKIGSIVIYVSDRPVVIMFTEKLSFYLVISTEIYCRTFKW